MAMALTEKWSGLVASSHLPFSPGPALLAPATVTARMGATFLLLLSILSLAHQVPFHISLSPNDFSGSECILIPYHSHNFLGSEGQGADGVGQ